MLFVPALVAAEPVSLPPGERPVPVSTEFVLANLSGVAERSETFEADIYVTFRWRDARLAFSGDEPQRFLEEDASARLTQMWWPQIEFVNTAEPAITNRALEISPAGAVRYLLGLTSEFRTNLDLRRFPFDHQTLEVRLQSFLWPVDDMVFVADTDRIGFSAESTFEGLNVTRVSALVRPAQLAGWRESYSEFVAVIDVQRNAAFYLWTVFVPGTLIFLISCTVFVVPIENFHDRVGISLAALLASIATQFAMSFNLPQISYLTVIDRVFLTAYACIAIGVLISTLQAAFLRNDPARSRRVDRWALILLPAAFVALILLAMVS
ncbi:MAG: hypothetical protein ACRERC_08540 [Candidatus Binatia bacterium]